MNGEYSFKFEKGKYVIYKNGSPTGEKFDTEEEAKNHVNVKNRKRGNTI